MAAVDLSPVLDALEAGRAAGWHGCAQVYVSRAGEVLLDEAIGETGPSRAVQTDDVMLWYSSGKPLTTAAVLRLWEQDRLALDAPIAEFVPGWASGKQRCTVRHVLIHTGGFPMHRGYPFDRDVTAAESLATVAAAAAEWEPGTAAGYHPASGWRVLGAVVEAVDGRPIDRYLHDEIIAPLGLVDCSLGIDAEHQRELGDRLIPITWRGYLYPTIDGDGAIQMLPYRIDEVHNEPWHVAKVEPSAGMRGPAHALGRFYESLLGFAPRVLEPRTVEMMGAIHRYGIPDRPLGLITPWGLGVQVEFSGSPGRRAFGHTGMASSRGLADPESGLVIVFVTDGLPRFEEAEQRARDVTDAVYSAFGAELAATRRTHDRFRVARGE